MTTSFYFQTTPRLLPLVVTDSQCNGYQISEERSRGCFSAKAILTKFSNTAVKKKSLFFLSPFQKEGKKKREVVVCTAEDCSLSPILSRPVNHTKRRMTEDKNVKWIIKFAAAYRLLSFWMCFWFLLFSSVFVDRPFYGVATVPARLPLDWRPKFLPSSRCASAVSVANRVLFNFKTPIVKINSTLQIWCHKQ